MRLLVREHATIALGLAHNEHDVLLMMMFFRRLCLDVHRTHKLAQAVLARKVPSRDEHDRCARAVHVDLEVANVLEVVDVEEDLDARHHLLEQLLDRTRLVLTRRPLVTHEDVVLVRLAVDELAVVARLPMVGLEGRDW